MRPMVVVALLTTSLPKVRKGSRGTRTKRQVLLIQGDGKGKQRCIEYKIVGERFRDILGCVSRGEGTAVV